MFAADGLYSRFENDGLHSSRIAMDSGSVLNVGSSP